MIQLPPHVVKKAKVLKSTVRYADLKPDRPKATDTAVIFMGGQKSPLERFFPLSEYFAQYYHTYGYEIPGMGVQKRNPESPATIKSLSLELADFIENVVTEPKVIVVAGSVGFWFTTEALLQVPKIRKKVIKIIALVGVLGQSTFGFTPFKKKIVLSACHLMQSNIGEKIVNSILHNQRLTNFYVRWMIRKRHLSHLPEADQKEYEEFERFLLKTGDWKIHFSTIEQYLTTNLSSKEKLDIPILSLYTEHDEYFPIENQRKCFEQTFNNINWASINLKRHAPLVVKDFHDYKKIVPEQDILQFLDK